MSTHLRATRTTADSVAPPPMPKVSVRQIAECRLRNSLYAAVRTLSCDFHAGVLTLRGRLPTYYLKQIAQTVIGELDGVLEIANGVEVVRVTDRLDGREAAAQLGRSNATGRRAESANRSDR